MFGPPKWASRFSIGFITGRCNKMRSLLANAKTYRVDVGSCNEQVFLLWAGIGLDAIIIHQLEPRPRFAKYVSVPQYFAATVWNAAMWHGMDLRVWADDQQVDGHYLLAVATNIRRYFGGIAVLSPNAYIDDGEMDMWLFSGDNIAVAFRHFVDLFAGRLLTSDQARRLPFHSVRVESEYPFRCIWMANLCLAEPKPRSRSKSKH